MRVIITTLVLSSGCLLPGGDSKSSPPRPPPPVVDEMSPTTGPYGTDITITGDGFGDTQGQIEAESGPVTVTSWTATEIHVRVPFPMGAAAFEISAPGGSVETPTFTPTSTWAAGPAMARPHTWLDARLAGSTLAVLGIDVNANVVVEELAAGNVSTASLAGVVGSTDDREPTRARLVGNGSGGFDVIATVANEVEVFPIAPGTPTPVDTKIAGTVLAATRDATGEVAWVAYLDAQQAVQLERIRPGAAGAAWQIDRGPFAITDSPLDAAIAADGTLVIAYSQDESTFFDHMAEVGIERLAPNATQFAAQELPEDMKWDDYIAAAKLALSADGSRMVLDYSTQEYDETTDHPQARLVRLATGAWQPGSAVSPVFDGDGAYAFAPAAIATLAANDSGLALVPDLTAPTQATELPLWGAEAQAVVIDDAGAPHAIVRVDDQMWMPTPP